MRGARLVVLPAVTTGKRHGSGSGPGCRNPVPELTGSSRPGAGTPSRCLCAVTSRPRRSTFSAPWNLSQWGRDVGAVRCAAALHRCSPPADAVLGRSAKDSGRAPPMGQPASTRRGTTKAVWKGKSAGGVVAPQRPPRQHFACANAQVSAAPAHLSHYEPGVAATCVWGHYTATSPGSLSGARLVAA